jgi:hypothetical protein
MNIAHRPGRPAWIRAVSAVLIVALMAFALGCYGSFPLTHAVYQFNGDAIDNSLGQTLLFWVFIILPVYWFAMLGDAVIFNLIEFWTGESLDVGQTVTTHGQYQTAMTVSDDGTTLTMTTTKDGAVVAQCQSVQVAPGTFEMRAADGTVVGTVHRTAAGDLELCNASGAVMRVITASQIADLHPAPAL